MTNQQGAPEALRVEAAYGGDGKFIGYRLLSSGAPGGLLVWADQTVMSGFRIGDHFVPGYQEVIEYKPVALVEAQQPAPSAAAAGDSGDLCRAIDAAKTHLSNARSSYFLKDMHRKAVSELSQAALALAQAKVLAQPSPTPQADSAPSAAADMHPKTADLVQRFAAALADKLAAAEKKYGYSDGWASPDWMDECRLCLREHLFKGDPRDVAAYCAFLWHHGESTALPSEVVEDRVKEFEQLFPARKSSTPQADSVTAPAGGSMGGWKLAPEEPTLHMGWAYLDAARESDPLRTHTFNHAGYRAMLAAAPTPPAQAADSVLEDAADPLQGAANWLVKAHSGLETSTLAGKLSIGYNRAKRLHDAARKQGANHD